MGIYFNDSQLLAKGVLRPLPSCDVCMRRNSLGASWFDPGSYDWPTYPYTGVTLYFWIVKQREWKKAGVGSSGDNNFPDSVFNLLLAKAKSNCYDEAQVSIWDLRAIGADLLVYPTI